jgi:hypothetical protein
MANRRYINFGVSQDEYAAIKTLADKNGMSPGQFCRVQALTESNLSQITQSQAEITQAQSEMNNRLSELLDRQTMKNILEYLNTNMPKLVYDYFQAQRAPR